MIQIGKNTVETILNKYYSNKCTCIMIMYMYNAMPTVQYTHVLLQTAVRLTEHTCIINNTGVLLLSLPYA